ncbi:MAG: hypothetical protein CM15mP108_1090 [Gammaproteobacteria bacterium]|nr:MAG: hypothetical protein CM15mP108_1090 [Gammaproteobacteria bacterium]
MILLVIPSIKLNNISINDIDLYVKAEYFNPASSVKDRLAVSIIENAESRNQLKKVKLLLKLRAEIQELG